MRPVEELVAAVRRDEPLTPSERDRLQMFLLVKAVEELEAICGRHEVEDAELDHQA